MAIDVGSETVEPDALRQVLTLGELHLEGRLVDASNATWRCQAELDGVLVACVYKPRRGERPLWDFPTGSLGNREVSAYHVSDALGWGLVPMTVWRDSGPAGAGMCQQWIEVDEAAVHVDIVPEGRVPPGWRHVLDATDGFGDPVSLVHSDALELRRMAAFDAVINNADRKGRHVLSGADSSIRAVDHGVAFNEDDKLRTVLWGWAGEPLDGGIADDLSRLEADFGAELEERLAEHLSVSEIRRTRSRLRRLLRDGVFPLPGEGWPPLPWPAF